MSEPQVWSDVQVNVESDRGSAAAIQSISLAAPGVVGSTTHGFLDNDILLLTLVGMRELNQCIVVVTAKTTDTYEMKGLDTGEVIDTTGFKAFISGFAEKLTFAAAADSITDVSPSGGESKDIDASTIHSPQDVVIPGNLSALVYALGAQWKPSDPAQVALRAFARHKATCGIEIVFSTGVKVYMASKPSASGAPGGSTGGVVTTPLKLNVQGPLSFFEPA